MNAPLPTGAGASHSGAGTAQTVRFPVKGMTCQACVVHITKAVKPLDGVERVSVNLRDETVTLRRDPGRAPDSAIAAAIVEAGYQPDLDTAQVVSEPDPRGFFERWFRR